MRYKGGVLGVGKSGEHTPWLNNHQDLRTYHLKVVGRAGDLSACCVLLNKRCCCISGRREQRRVCGVCPRRRSGGQILSPAGAACFLLLFLCCMAVLRAVLCQCLTAGAEGRCGASASGEGQVAIAAGLISIPAVRSYLQSSQSLERCALSFPQPAAGVQSAAEGLEGMSLPGGVSDAEG